MNTTTLSPDLLAATHALADTLIQTEPLVAFHRARKALDNDATATGLLNAVTASQADVRHSQAYGRAATRAALDHLRELQRQLQNDSTILNYLDAQRDTAAYLLGVNTDISESLGIDFAALSNVATC